MPYDDCHLFFECIATITVKFGEEPAGAWSACASSDQNWHQLRGVYHRRACRPDRNEMWGDGMRGFLFLTSLNKPFFERFFLLHVHYIFHNIPFPSTIKVVLLLSNQKLFTPPPPAVSFYGDGPSLNRLYWTMSNSEVGETVKNKNMFP